LLNAALQAIRNGAEFVATNADATYPVENGREEPGAGALVEALRTCSGVEPHVCGKPKPDMIYMALESCEVSAREALVIGDRVDTDIESANAAGANEDAIPDLSHVLRERD
jgi:4-nitrophenyl phosphatase